MLSLIKSLNKPNEYKKRRLVVAGAHDETIIKAVYEARDNLGKPILIGTGDVIRDLLQSYRFSARVVDAPAEEIAQVAVGYIRSGQGELLMKGMLETKTLLKAVVNRETGIRKAPLMSHVTVMKHPREERLLIASDCAMVVAPSFAEKIHIIENAAVVARALGIDIPKIAVISASETVNPKMPSSVDGEALMQYYRDRTDMVVEGPFALDNVISKTAAAQKGICSRVAGSADVLIFPNLDAGNVFYKAAVYLAGMMPAGLIIGAAVPIILTSRADDAPAKYCSIMLAKEVGDATLNSCH